jgi:hypothetical protein
MKMILALAALRITAIPAAAQSPYDSLTLSTTTGRARRSTSGYVTVAKSSSTPSTYTIVLEGPTGSVRASSGTFIYGVNAASGNFTSTVTASAYLLTGGGNVMTTASTDTITAPKTHSAPITLNSTTTLSGEVLGTVNTSTQTILRADYTVTNTMGVCLTGTTVQMTIDNIPVRIQLSGGTLNAPNSNMQLNVLVDGNYVSPFSSSTYMQYFTNAENSGSNAPASINVETPTALSAGAHFFCLSQRSTSASNGIDCTDSPCVLRIQEAH